MQKKKAIVIDIDGTLLLFNGLPNFELIDLVKRYRERFLYKVIILTARQDLYSRETIEELRSIGVKFDKLIMNRTKKFPDVFKIEELRRNILPHYDVIKIFDDDDSNIYAFRKLGLNAVQVDELNGNFMKD